MSTDRSASPPSLPLILALLAWAAVVYVAYAVSYLD
jgi:hypothetical protein